MTEIDPPLPRTASILLYAGPLSMFSAKVEIALREKNLAYTRELVPFSLKAGYAPRHPVVVAGNPKGQVPVIVHEGMLLYDSTQIFEYLEDIAPGVPLWPCDPRARARARQWEHWSDEILFAAALRLLDRNMTADDRRAAIAAVGDHLAALEAHMEGRRYIADVFGFADIAIFMTDFFAVLFGAPRHHRPNIDAWRARLTDRETVRAVAEPMAHFAETLGLRRSDDLFSRQGTPDG